MHTKEQPVSPMQDLAPQTITNLVPVLASCGSVTAKDHEVQVRLVTMTICLLESHGVSEPWGRVMCRLAVLSSDGASSK